MHMSCMVGDSHLALAPDQTQVSRSRCDVHHAPAFLPLPCSVSLYVEYKTDAEADDARDALEFVLTSLLVGGREGLSRDEESWRQRLSRV